MRACATSSVSAHILVQLCLTPGAVELVKRVYRYGGRAKRLPDAIVPDMMQCAHAYSGYINDRFWADSVAKVFLG